MVKRAISIFLVFIIIIFIFIGPMFFKKYWVDYRESYESKKNSVKWKGVITFWDYPKLDTVSGSRYGWINRRIKEFEKLHPGTYIEYRTIDPVYGKLTLRAASKIGACPDVAPIGSDMYFLSSGLLEPLDNYILEEEKDDFLEEALSSCIYNGALYGIPWARKAYTLLLNKDIFQDREVEIPNNGFWTYEEFLESLKKLTFDSERRGGIDTYGLLGFIETGYYNIFGILMNDGAVIIDEINNNYSFDSPEALSGLKKLSDLNNKYKVLYPEICSITQNRAFNLFLSGKAAVFLGDAWMVPYLRNVGSKYGLNFTIAHYPSKNKKLPLYINEIYYSYGIFIQDDTAKKEVCIEFIKFLSDKKFQDELKNFGYFPVRKSCNHIYQNDKEMYTIQRGLDSAKHISSHKYWWEIDEIIQYSVIDVLKGNKTPEKALQEAKELTSKYVDN